MLSLIRFKKYDQFDNPVFIASLKSEVNAEENNNFNKLKKYHSKLENKQYDTFLPIYHNPEYGYCTIRFIKNNNPKSMGLESAFTTNSIYNIEYCIKKKNKNDKTYINCFINKATLVTKAEPVDEGEVLDLDSEM